jgi:hypothetical protein
MQSDRSGSIGLLKVTSPLLKIVISTHIGHSKTRSFGENRNNFEMYFLCYKTGTKTVLSTT